MNRLERKTQSTVKQSPWVFGLMLAGIFMLGAMPLDVEANPEKSNLEQWQLRRLNDPSERERMHERKGNVYIYEGLTDHDVEAALEKNFDRIEYMMFLGTLKTDPAGSLLVNANGDGEAESSPCGN